MFKAIVLSTKKMLATRSSSLVFFPPLPADKTKSKRDDHFVDDLAVGVALNPKLLTEPELLPLTAADPILAACVQPYIGKNDSTLFATKSSVGSACDSSPDHDNGSSYDLD